MEFCFYHRFRCRRFISPSSVSSVPLPLIRSGDRVTTKQRRLPQSVLIKIRNVDEQRRRKKPGTAPKAGDIHRETKFSSVRSAGLSGVLFPLLIWKCRAMRREELIIIIVLLRVVGGYPSTSNQTKQFPLRDHLFAYAIRVLVLVN